MAWREFFDIIMPLISAEEPEEMPEEVQEVLTEEEKVPEQAQEMPKAEPEMPKPVEKEEKPVADQQAAGTPEEIAPAQKSPSPIVGNNVKTDSTIAKEQDEEVEQVEIDDILPVPIEPDAMRDLKDRFMAELNSLKIMLECENFSGMAQTIERLEHLRIKMAGLAALQG